jgi:hypothetical protein
MKPYVKLAYTLVAIGGAIFFFERYGLSHMEGSHIPGWLITVLVVAPVLLVVAGALIWMVGRMRRL